MWASALILTAAESLSDCYDVSEMGNITRELVKRGYTAAQIEKIWGGNLMRVLVKHAELHLQTSPFPFILILQVI